MLALTVTELNEPVRGLHGLTLVCYLEEFKFLFLGFVLGVKPEYGVGDCKYQGYTHGYSEQQLRYLHRSQFE